MKTVRISPPNPPPPSIPSLSTSLSCCENFISLFFIFPRLPPRLSTRKSICYPSSDFLAFSFFFCPSSGRKRLDSGALCSLRKLSALFVLVFISQKEAKRFVLDNQADSNPIKCQRLLLIAHPWLLTIAQRYKKLRICDFSINNRLSP